MMSLDLVSSCLQECNEKESDKTSRDPHEQGILDEQSQIPEFKSSFLGLYRHANTVDMCIVFASTLASIIAGALHPTAPVSCSPHHGLSLAEARSENMTPLTMSAYRLSMHTYFNISLELA
jgi:hypothetical protein